MNKFISVLFLFAILLFVPSCEKISKETKTKKASNKEVTIDNELVKDDKPVTQSPEIPRVKELPSFADLVKKLKPAVVNISTTSKIKQRGMPFSSPFEQGDPFEEYFRRFFGDIPEREYKQRGLGTGFIISEDGYVVTNNHVISKAEDIEIILEDGSKYEAEVVGKDPKTDLALLKIESDSNLPYVNFGNSDKSQIGDWVIAIGNPFGFGHTVTSGIISAKGRVLGLGNYDDFLQTDAPINPGNSGGPLFNLQGEVVGVNTAMIARGQGIGFSIPVNLVRNIVEQIKEKGKVIRGWLGVYIQKVTPEIADVMGIEHGEGVLVADVTEDSPAEKAGLKRGDIILAIDGGTVKEVSDLTGKVALLSPGTQSTFSVIRDGNEKDITVNIGEFPEKEKVALEKETPNRKFGLTVDDLTEKLINRYDLPKEGGVIVTSVTRGSIAADAGFKRGDVILEINKVKIKDINDYNNTLDNLSVGDSTLFLVHRRGNSIYIGLKIEK